MDAHSLVKPQANRNIPAFGAGDTVKVNYRVKEGDRVRIQPFQGVVLLRKGGTSPSAAFTVRRISNNVGIERIFPLHSPHIASVEIIRRGKVRRARLYYLRNLSGKAARIKESSKPRRELLPKNNDVDEETPVIVQEIPVSDQEASGPSNTQNSTTSDELAQHEEEAPAEEDAPAEEGVPAEKDAPTDEDASAQSKP